MTIQVGKLAKIGRPEAGTSQTSVRARQDAFLGVYRQIGNIRASCEASGVGRSTAYHWIKTDVSGFTVRFESAKADFCESLETKAVQIARETKAGQNPTVLLTLMAANMPEKYGKATAVDPLAGELLTELRKLSAYDRRRGVRADSRAKASGDLPD